LNKSSDTVSLSWGELKITVWELLESVYCFLTTMSPTKIEKLTPEQEALIPQG
jgi:hypothetical protein